MLDRGMAMSGNAGGNEPSGSRIGSAMIWMMAAFAGFLTLVAAVVVGLGKLMLVLADPSSDDSTHGSSTFLAASAAIAALTLAALLTTLVYQQRKSTVREVVLGRQTEELNRAFQQLQRSAEADLRSLHVELMKIGIDNPELAPVWAGLENVSPERSREIIYCNLIFSHYLLMYRLDADRVAEIRGFLRIQMHSRVFREYWAATRVHRDLLDAEGDERRFAAVVDAALSEFERGSRGSGNIGP
jgi:hypothetical protein